jgi:hypothetical protein
VTALRGSTASGGGGAPAPVNVATEFIFRPGAVAAGNVYTSWAALMTAYAAVEAPSVVWFDSSLAPIVLPAGAWSAPYRMDWRGIELVAGFPGGQTEVTLADGFTLSTPDGSIPLSISDSLLVVTLAAAAGSGVSPLNPTAGGSILALARGGIIRADGDLPMLVCAPDPVPTLIVLLTGGGEVRFGAAPAVEIPANVTCLVVETVSPSAVEAGTFSGLGTLAGFYGAGNPDVRVNAADQPAVAGGVIETLGTIASLCGYTPTTPTDWAAPVPMNIESAVNRIAAALAGLLPPGGIP